ncbi:MAG: T9SS type A sorting domain-containing protein [Chitinophagaceae bacterium]|nr:MAG: T9SS type A sorting domain-containing protein [Chitinophagaceae bacterium]
MNKGLCLVLCFLFFQGGVSAQSPRYLIQFRHKGGTSSSINNPSTYLSQRAIERRIRFGIPVDSTDLPVPSAWINEVEAIPNVTVLNVSRWMNTLSVLITDPSALDQVNALPYVLGSTNIAARGRLVKDKTESVVMPVGTSKGQSVLDDYYNYGTGSLTEINVHKGQFLHNLGLRGQGLHIAILDAGFNQYTTLRSFDSLNADNRVLDTWDFVARNSSVVEDDSHGMACLSIIAANIPGVFTGKAPAASFYLYRTEDVSSEYPIEEFNWACAAERADSAGADLISSSLGYGYGFSGGFPDYPYTSLDGNTTISARAADRAAAKGLLVFNAAGNSGTDYWKKITTPADGDSVVAVGAVNISGNVGAFSSYGPSADGRVKPDVASVGVAAMIQASNNSIVASNGTSYACPNMAGLATCLWQGFPEVNNMRIIRALRESGSKSTTPDDRIGYGIPDLKKAFNTLLQEYATASVTQENCTAKITWTTKDVDAMLFHILRKTASDADYVNIGGMRAAPGNTLASHSYEFTDRLTDQAAGTISYRIVQFTDTAAASRSSILVAGNLTLALEAVCPDPLFTGRIWLAPNPVTGSTATILFNTNETIPQLFITVYDMKGQQLIRKRTSKTTGFYSYPLDVSGLPRGKYLLQLSDGAKKIQTLELLKP